MLRNKLLTVALGGLILAPFKVDAYSIYPVPQKITIATSSVDFPSKVNLVVADGVNDVTVARAREVLSSVGITTVTTSSSLTSGCDLVIGINGSGDIADKIATESGISRSVFDGGSHKFDPHIVRLDSQGDFLVLGDSDGSAYYGLATVLQVLEQPEGSSLPCFTVEDYSHTRYRGVVEGFYGHPFSIECRKNIFDYFKRYKLNYYLYAPKADPYHAGKWREAYPETITDTQRNLGQITADELRDLTAKAHECNVDLVWAIHPALGGPAINFNNIDAGVTDVMAKFEMMYDLGFRHFGVSVDDMSGHPTTQWQLGDKVQTAVDEKWNTPGADPDARVGHVVFVPTQYALNYDSSNRSLSPFKQANENLEMVFTGYDCFSNIRNSSFTQMANIVGRDPIFWWNNPVNDDYDEFIYMHGLSVRWYIEQTTPVDHIKGFLLNPMNQGQVSKICFFNGADYAWNPATYNEPESWKAAVASMVHTPELNAALHEFIRCVSAYTTRDTRTPEGEEYADLYTACKTDIQNGKTTGFDELYERMTATVEACHTLRTMENSDIADHRLLFEDLEPWINKVEEQAELIARSIEILNGKASLDRWTEFLSLNKRAAAISTDKRYQHSALEGHGTSTYEVWREVQPTPGHMDSFVKFITATVANYSPELPAAPDCPEIITNLDQLPEEVNYTNNEALNSLNGLSTVELPFSYYIGVALGSLCKIDIAEFDNLAEGLTLETSVNGKIWTPLTSEDTRSDVITAYLRIYNPTDEPIQVALSSLDWEMPYVAAEVQPKASTNMGTYQTYTIDKVIDGDESSYFWSNSRQKEGDYVMLDFESVGPRYAVKLVFNKGDHPAPIVSLQTSGDGNSWNTATTFTDSDIVDNVFVYDLGGVEARYVRIILGATSTNNWLQLAEFSVTSREPSTVASASDSKGIAIRSLNDRQLSTSYTPSGEGWIIYRFTENLAIETVKIFHMSEFDIAVELPAISVMESGDTEWNHKGVLNEPCTSIVVEDMPNLEQLKIEWNDKNLPTIHEVLPIGQAYVQQPIVKPDPDPEPDPIAIDDINRDIAMTAVCRDGIITITTQQPIRSIRLIAPDGCVIFHSSPMSPSASLRAPHIKAILEIVTTDGRRTTTIL